ncbi:MULTISPECIES: 2Fe-2S iron-sulfur cluster-binding protein [unclassified Dietzia]|uniref:2Fe-2S iron-sulfur cluster-binding protein n=1 Tax=unclassified Dietzia TaxID=2617939 RepID=UPI000D21386E|nr:MULTISPECIES: 2Fe-2S iron-sulfur cluster-binding protein [unclassified Dietzia]AVZ38416.1 oxidoreductase [Dietzia sp. JS16-p6b]QGW23446.1 phenol hydrolase [Dietzia sp. DQ12-45-1b]
MAFTVTLGDGTRFEAPADRSVLESALRAGRWMPHACAQGTCGTCKFTVVSGTVDHGASCTEVLTPCDRASGRALACQSRPLSDLTASGVGGEPAPRVVHALRGHSGRVVELTPVATDTVRLVVELSEPMEFSPGQYCEFDVPGTDVRRQYSIASTPRDGSRLEFHIRRVSGGLATERWIFRDLAVGDPVHLRGPMGSFFLDGALDEEAILIGGGTGVAPLKSIAVHALENALLPRISLYHGCRTRSDLYDVEFFRDLESTHRQFSYHPVLSEETWEGASGLVTDAVLGDFPSCRGHVAFLCGPPPMIEAGVRALRRRRMPSRLMHREEFTPSAPTPAVGV